MKNRKILNALLLIILSVATIACSKDDNDPSNNDNNINTVIMKKGQMYFYLGRIFIAKKISGNDVLPTKSWGAVMSWHPIRHCKIIEGIINFKL